MRYSCKFANMKTSIAKLSGYSAGRPFLKVPWEKRKYYHVTKEHRNYIDLALRTGVAVHCLVDPVTPSVRCERSVGYKMEFVIRYQGWGG